MYTEHICFPWCRVSIACRARRGISTTAQQATCNTHPPLCVYAVRAVRRAMLLITSLSYDILSTPAVDVKAKCSAARHPRAKRSRLYVGMCTGKPQLTLPVPGPAGSCAGHGNRGGCFWRADARRRHLLGGGTCSAPTVL